MSSKVLTHFWMSKPWITKVRETLLMSLAANEALHTTGFKDQKVIVKWKSNPRSKAHFEQMFTQQPLLSTMEKLKRTTVQAFNMVYCDWTSVQAVNCSKQTRVEMRGQRIMLNLELLIRPHSQKNKKQTPIRWLQYASEDQRGKKIIQLVISSLLLHPANMFGVSHF